jgi:hypothetical protein
VEALNLKTLDDLLLSPDERVELIGGEIVRRPMARFAHALQEGDWRTIATLKDRERTRIPPFEAVELDLDALLGGG